MTTRGAFEHRRMVLEKAPFAGGAEAADRACAPATDWQPMQRSAAPRNAGRVGRDCLGLVCVAPAASSRHLPSLFSAQSAAGLAQPLQTVPGSGRMQRGPNLQSEVWRRASFSHSARLGGCTGKGGGGCQGLDVPVWAGDMAWGRGPAPGLRPCFLLYSL